MKIDRDLAQICFWGATFGLRPVPPSDHIQYASSQKKLKTVCIDRAYGILASCQKVYTKNTLQ